MATLHRQPPPGSLFHSDRGVQYAAGNFRSALAAAGLTASMSRRADCYDNAAMESFSTRKGLPHPARRVATGLALDATHSGLERI